MYMYKPEYVWSGEVLLGGCQSSDASNSFLSDMDRVTDGPTAGGGWEQLSTN